MCAASCDCGMSYTLRGAEPTCPSCGVPFSDVRKKALEAAKAYRAGNLELYERWLDGQRQYEARIRSGPV
jgi:hypothetical protein